MGDHRDYWCSGWLNARVVVNKTRQDHHPTCYFRKEMILIIIIISERYSDDLQRGQEKGEGDRRKVHTICFPTCCTEPNQLLVDIESASLEILISLHLLRALLSVRRSSAHRCSCLFLPFLDANCSRGTF